MSWLLWAGLASLLMVSAFAAFFRIARKGHELRKNQPLPPPAERAYLRWELDGQTHDREVSAPFYLGKDPTCQVVLEFSRVAYEACIFYHHSRFAFQTLPGGGPIVVNGEEKMAGYLWDGDEIRVAQQTFRFLCY